jgi:hypothetical protein
VTFQAGACSNRAAISARLGFCRDWNRSVWQPAEMGLCALTFAFLDRQRIPFLYQRQTEQRPVGITHQETL